MFVNTIYFVRITSFIFGLFVTLLKFANFILTDHAQAILALHFNGRNYSIKIATCLLSGRISPINLIGYLSRDLAVKLRRFNAFCANEHLSKNLNVVQPALSVTN